MIKKKISLYLLFVFAGLVFPFDSTSGQTTKEDKTAGLPRQCTAKENTGAIQADKDGNIRLAPCAGKTATVSGTPTNDWMPFDNGRFDVTSYGAAGDGEADDTAAIQAAINAASASGAGAEVYFPRPREYYKVEGQLSLYEKQGITLQGVGGNITGGIKGAIVFTKGGNTPMIDARGGKGCRFFDLKLMYSSPAYTGDFLDYSGLSSGDSGTMVMSRVLIAGSDFNASPITVKNARSLIRIHGAISSIIEKSYFSAARAAILGKTRTNADGTAAYNGFYVNKFDIESNQFVNLVEHPIQNLGESCVINGNTFEQRIGNLSGAYKDTELSNNLIFTNNWLGDASQNVTGSTVDDSWVVFGGLQFTASGNNIGIASSPNAFAFTFKGRSQISTVTLHDNYYESNPRPVNFQNTYTRQFTSYNEVFPGGNYVYANGAPGKDFTASRIILNGYDNEIGNRTTFTSGFSVFRATNRNQLPSINFIGQTENIDGLEPYALTYSTYYGAGAGDKPHQFLTSGQLRFAIAENITAFAPFRFGSAGVPISRMTHGICTLT